MHNRRLVKTRLNRRLRIAATAIVSLAGLIALAFLATFYYLKPTLPDVAQLRDVRLQLPLRVYSRDGRLLGQIGEQRRVPVTWEEIPLVVVQAVLAAEDDRFFAAAEDGLFPKAIARVDPQTHAPTAAVVLMTVMGVIFILIRTFTELADQFIIGIWPFYALAVAGVFVLRRSRPDLERASTGIPQPVH